MFKSKLRNTLLAASMAAGGLIMGTAPAYATPGTVFTGTDFIFFDVGTENPGVGPGGFVSVTPTELEWRDDAPDLAPNSFLRILSPSNTAVNITSDSGVWVDTGRIQHENNIIPGGNFNFTIDVLNSFEMVQPVVFELTGDNTLPEVTLNVSFTETTNSVPCPAPNPLGSTCDDIFVIANLDDATGTFRFFDPGTNEDYDLTFRVLAEAAAGSFFDDAGNIVYTAEAFTSNLFLQAQLVQVEQVPEPGSLALLGIGLTGLPLVLARRRAKKAEAKKA